MKRTTYSCKRKDVRANQRSETRLRFWIVIGRDTRQFSSHQRPGILHSDWPDKATCCIYRAIISMLHNKSQICIQTSLRLLHSVDSKQQQSCLAAVRERQPRRRCPRAPRQACSSLSAVLLATSRRARSDTAVELFMQVCTVLGMILRVLVVFVGCWDGLTTAR